MNKTSRGFTLIELMLSMTIGMLIMASAYAVYRQTHNDQMVKQTYDLVEFLVQEAQDVTATKTVYTVDNVGGGQHDVTVADLVNAVGGIEGMPLGTVLLDTSTLGHPLGGNVSVGSESSNGVDKDLFTVTLTGIPDEVCVQLLTRLNNVSIYDMYVNNNLVGLAPAATAASIGRDQVRVDHAANLCNASANSTIKLRKLKDINYSKMRAGPYGGTMSAAESARVTPIYTRQENALAAREAAQLALP